MTSIVKATVKDFQLLGKLAATTFMESHGSSGPLADINQYINEHYNYEAFKKELNDPGNIYHIIYYDQLPAGFSKIILDTPYAGSPIKNITKLERLYILKDFYGLKPGAELFNFNIDLSKRQGQTGIWLYTWKENHRAINFYKKNGFVVIGSHDFKISPTHSNPNYQMLLIY